MKKKKHQFEKEASRWDDATDTSAREMNIC